MINHSVIVSGLTQSLLSKTGLPNFQTFRVSVVSREEKMKNWINTSYRWRNKSKNCFTIVWAWVRNSKAICASSKWGSCLCLIKEGTRKAELEVGFDAWEVDIPRRGTVRESKNHRLDGPEPCLGTAWVVNPGKSVCRGELWSSMGVPLWCLL